MIDTTPQATQSGPDRNQTFAVLSSPRRRIVLRILDTESSMALTELANRVERRERADGRTSIGVGNVRMDLYHCHLPKLADAGFIEYTGEFDAVTLRDTDGDVPATLAGPE